MKARESEQMRALSVLPAFGPSQTNPLISSQKVRCLWAIVLSRGRTGTATPTRNHYLFKRTLKLNKWRGAALHFYGVLQQHAIFPHLDSIGWSSGSWTLKHLHHCGHHCKILPLLFALLLCDLYCFIPNWLMVLIRRQAPSLVNSRRECREAKLFPMEAFI